MNRSGVWDFKIDVAEGIPIKPVICQCARQQDAGGKGSTIRLKTATAYTIGIEERPIRGDHDMRDGHTLRLRPFSPNKMRIITTVIVHTLK